jgi:8-oxo-dGTP pyrophosphatase MutT (NUDIX family)
VVILDPDGCVLLQHHRSENWEGWITPGGAIEDGETAEQAALRELIEEVGLADTVLTGPLWSRSLVLEWKGVVYEQQECFFVARLDERVEAAPMFDADALAAEGVLGHQWWRLEDLAHVVVAPEDLVERVRALL